MTTYNYAAVADAAIAFEKGMTLQQGRALRDNPIAITEAAAGAPQIVVAALRQAYNSVTVAVAPGTPVNVNLSDYAFLPSVTVGATTIASLECGPVTHVFLTNTGVTTSSSTVAWRNLY